MSRPDLFMPYLCDLVFIFIFISLLIKNLVRTGTHFADVLENVLLFLSDNADEECE